MAYTPDPTDVSQPTGAVIAQTAAAEFRALKSYIQTFQSIVQSMSSTDHSIRIAISGGGLIATLLPPTSALYAAARAAYGKSSGKWYWEMMPTVIGGVPSIMGIASISASLDSYIGSDIYGYGYGGVSGQQFTGGVATALGAPFIANDVIGFAFDADAGTLQIFKNNVSQGTITGIVAGAYYPAISMVTAGDKTTAAFDEQTIVYDPPAGFSAYYNSTNIARPAVPVRQCALAGPIDANGAASFLTAGVGLAANLVAVPDLVATTANGFTSNGGVDTVVQISGTQANFFTALAPSNKSYVGVDSIGSAFKTIAPVQYRTTYDRTKQNVLQFGGAVGTTVFLDDFGNTWVAVGGAKVQTNQFKFGTGALGGGGALNVLNGTTDNIRSTSSNSFGNGGWSVRAWVYCTTLPTAGNVMDVIATSRTGASNTDGIRLGIYNNGGVIKFAVFVSGDGATNNILSAVVGTTTPVINTWYFVELTYDAVGGNYRIYVNGLQESATASALIVCNYAAICIGSSCAAAQFFSGYIDNPEILPYCEHPAGTAYAVPTAAPDITVDGYSSMWFDTVNYVMNRPTVASTVAGTNPTMSAQNRVILGEITTSAAAPTTLSSYAYEGKYVGPLTTPLPAANTTITTSPTIGTQLYNANVELINLVTEFGWLPGDVLENPAAGVAAAAYLPFSLQKGKITTTLRTGATNAFIVVNNLTGAATGLTTTSWAYRIKAQRSF